MKALLGLLLASYCCLVAAQLRDLPLDAKRGKLRHIFDMDVEIDGSLQRLSRGAQIRDADNRVVVPMGVAPGSEVKYRLDDKGLVREVWILSPREAAQPDKQP